MADPTKYIQGYDYSAFEAVNPSDPKPGAQLDNEFAMLENSISETVDALKDVRRSDGQLKSGSVGPDQISSALSIGFTQRGEWAEGEVYNTADGTVYDGTFYKALVGHTATAGNRPDLDATKWEVLFSVSTLSVSDGSITAAKLSPGDKPAIRAFMVQETFVAEAFSNASAKTSLVDADQVGITDSAASGVFKKITWANFKAAVWGAFGSLLAGGTAKATIADGDSLPISDSADSDTAKKVTWSTVVAQMFASIGAAVAAGTGKTSPADADSLLLADSAASQATRRFTWANLKASLNTYFQGLGGLTLAAGDILYATGAGALARLAKGTNGQVLMLSGGVPAWGSGASGGIVTEATASVSSGTTVTFTNIPTSYTDLEITLAWLSFVSGSDTLDIELSDDNGSSWAGPFEVSAALGSSGDRFGGTIRVVKAGGNAPTTAYKVIQSMILDTSLSIPEIRSYVDFSMSDPVNAVRLSGGTFDGSGGPVSVRTWR